MSETQGTDFTQLLDGVGDKIRHAIEGILGPASPGAIFSEPHARDDDLVFTAAAWERGGGFGFGAGYGEDSESGNGAGGGGGGGAGSQGRPVAVIRVGPDRIEVKPIIDLTKIGLTVLISAIGVWKALR